MRPIIVVGPGRCGTSTVARLLVELGVDMGTGFRADPSNPDGFYEDRYIRTLDQARLAGRLSPEEWSQAMLRVAGMRDARPGRWGWKDPRTAELISDVVRLFPDALFVRCYRPRKDTIASCMRWYGFTEPQAAEMVDRRTGNLDRALGPLKSQAVIVEVVQLANDIEDVRQRLAAALSRTAIVGQPHAEHTAEEFRKGAE